MNIQIDDSDLIAEITRSMGIAGQVMLVAKDAIEKQSYRTEQLMKAVMPVDTRRAAATWGHADGFLVKPNERYNASEAVWRTDDAGLSITQGLALQPYNYVDNLNAGSSTQAPAGFIDTQAERAGIELESELGVKVEAKVIYG